MSPNIVDQNTPLVDIVGLHQANAFYRVNNDRAMANNFIALCEIMAANPSLYQHGGGSQMQYDRKLLLDMANNARQWLGTSTASAAGGGLVFSDVTNFRGF